MTTFLGIAMDVVLSVVGRLVDELLGTEDLDLIPDPRARAIVAAQAKACNARIRRKDVNAMKIVAAAFDVAGVFTSGIPTGDDFLNHFATTLGAEIFIPLKMLQGDPKALVALVAHECEHVEQFRREGYAMPWLYATESEARAKYEADGYGTGLDVAYAFGYGLPASLDDIAPSLVSAYHLRAEDVDLAKDLLRSHAASVGKRITMTLSARTTLKLVAQYAPEWLVAA